MVRDKSTSYIGRCQMKLSEKIKAIRLAEGLNQTQLCNMIDLSISTLGKYETGVYEPSGLNLLKITEHPRFEKYSLWLMTGKTAPEVGQIAPTLAHSGQEKEILPHSEKKIG